MNNIGRLVRVPLREVWKHEAHDFTVWLQHNVDVVNEITGLDLTSIEREQAAGAFSIDLVAEDAGGGKVIIENQLEKSNHDHLGKLITYLSAMNAHAAIWIVSEPRPEHVAAMSWLNDSSSADFYLLKIEAVRIGTSPPAPLLSIIVKPSENKPSISGANQEFAERHTLRTTWWRMLLANPLAKRHAHLTPSHTLYFGTKWGVPGLSLTYILSQHESGVELFIGRGSAEQNQSVFDVLQVQKGAIEAAFGAPLIWDRMEGKNGCRVRAMFQGGYRAPEGQWAAIQERQVDAMRRLEDAFAPWMSSVRVHLGEVGLSE
jgi:hypothetical protein